jgi:hypothetical protein
LTAARGPCRLLEGQMPLPIIVQQVQGGTGSSEGRVKLAIDRAEVLKAFRAPSNGQNLEGGARRSVPRP